MMKHMNNKMYDIGRARLYIGIGILVALLASLFVFKLLDRPTKAFCQYILSEDKAAASAGSERVIAVEAFPAEITQ